MLNKLLLVFICLSFCITIITLDFSMVVLFICCVATFFLDKYLNVRVIFDKRFTDYEERLKQLEVRLEEYNSAILSFRR